MNPEKFIASIGVRRATLALALLCVVVITSQQSDFFSETREGLQILAISSGVLALIGAIYSFRVTYDVWMRSAKILNTVVITLLFGMTYIAVVPLFAAVLLVMDPLRLRRRSKNETFWVPRLSGELDLTSLQRLG